MAATPALSLERQAHLLLLWGTGGQLKEGCDIQGLVDERLAYLRETAAKGEQALAGRVRSAAEFDAQLIEAMAAGRDDTHNAAGQIAAEGEAKLETLPLLERGLDATVRLYAIGEKSLADVTRFVDVLREGYGTDMRNFLACAHFMHGDGDQGLTVLAQLEVHRRGNTLELYVVEMLSQRRFEAALVGVERLVDLQDQLNFLSHCSKRVFLALAENQQWDLYERAIRSIVIECDRGYQAYDLAASLEKAGEQERARRILGEYRDRIEATSTEDRFFAIGVDELRERLNPKPS